MPSSPPASSLQAAVDAANAAIRGFLRGLPGFCPGTVGERAELSGLVDAYMAAVAERDAGREDEDARAA